MSELSSCPFCGGSAEIRHSGKYWWIECADCLCRTGAEYSEDDAKKAWYKRHDSLHSDFIIGAAADFAALFDKWMSGDFEMNPLQEVDNVGKEGE